MAMTGGLIYMAEWYPGKYFEGINIALADAGRLSLAIGPPIDRSEDIAKLVPKLAMAFLTQLRNPQSLAFKTAASDFNETALVSSLPLPSPPTIRDLYPDIALGDNESPGTMLTNYLLQNHRKLMLAIADIWVFDLSPLAAVRDVEIIVIDPPKPTNPDEYSEPGVFAVRWIDSEGEGQYEETITGDGALSAGDMAQDILEAVLVPRHHVFSPDLIQEICGATFAETLDNIILPSKAHLSPKIKGYANHTYQQWFAELNKKLTANGISLNPYSRTINRYSA